PARLRGRAPGRRVSPREAPCPRARVARGDARGTSPSGLADDEEPAEARIPLVEGALVGEAAPPEEHDRKHGLAAAPKRRRLLAEHGEIAWSPAWLPHRRDRHRAA